MCPFFTKSMACFHRNLSSSLVLKLICRISSAGWSAIISLSDTEFFQDGKLAELPPSSLIIVHFYLQSNNVPMVQHPHMTHLHPLLSYSPEAFSPQRASPGFSPDSGTQQHSRQPSSVYRRLSFL